MNGAFFLVSGLWLFGAMVPNHFPTGKRSGAEIKAPDQDLRILNGIGSATDLHVRSQQHHRRVLDEAFDLGEKLCA